MIYRFRIVCRLAAGWLAIGLGLIALPVLADTTVNDATSAAAPEWTFQVLYTGNRATEIEPVSLASRSLMGGLAYEATLLTQSESSPLPTLKVDTGNFARLNMTTDAWLRTHTLLSYFAQYDFDAVNVTAIDLRYGIDELKALAAEGQAPLISANLYEVKTNELLFPAYRIVSLPRSGSERLLKIGIIGVSGDPNLAKLAPYAPPAEQPQRPDKPPLPRPQIFDPETPEWQLNQAPATQSPLRIYNAADRRILLAQADPTITPAAESKAPATGMTKEADAEEERRLQQSLREGLSYFEHNMENTMKLEAGPAAAKKMEQEAERAKNPKPTPVNFANIGVYHYPTGLGSETTMIPGRVSMAETPYSPSGMRQTETAYAPSMPQSETEYKPVMKAIPNTLDKRTPAPDSPTPAPTSTPSPESTPQAKAAPARGEWQYVEIDGADVIFSRRPAKGGGDDVEAKEDMSGPQSAPIHKPISTVTPRIFNPNHLRHELARVEVRDPMAAVGHYLPILKKQEQCDLIVILTYYPIDNTRNLMAPLMSDVDLWIAGDWMKPYDQPEQTLTGWLLPTSFMGQTLHKALAAVDHSGRISKVQHQPLSISPSHIEADPMAQALVGDCQARIATETKSHRAANGLAPSQRILPSETN